MLQLLSLLCTLMLMFTMQGFGRSPASYVQGATGFGPNFSRVRAMERSAGADLSKITRAPRPDALTMPQIACGSDSALLAEIKQCVCQLRNLVERCACSQNEEILSELQILINTTNGIASNVDLVLIGLGALSNLDGFVSSFDVLISSIDTLDLGDLTSLTDSINVLSSKIDKMDTQLDTIESLLENQENCCSTIDVVGSIISNITASCSGIDELTTIIESIGDDLASVVEQILERTTIIQSEVELLTLDLSLLPVIDSKADVLLFNVGSRSDFAFSQTDQLSTIDQINALDLTVIALLKTILADLHGL